MTDNRQPDPLQKEEADKPDCANHKKDIVGVGDMAALAKMIGELHYETLGELLFNLAHKIDDDADNDFEGGRRMLAKELYEAALRIYDAQAAISRAWAVSKPFMTNKDHENTSDR